MQQRILTFSRRFNVIDSYGMNLDDVTKQLNENGWNVKQIISTTFSHQIGKDSQPYPVRRSTNQLSSFSLMIAFSKPSTVFFYRCLHDCLFI